MSDSDSNSDSEHSEGEEEEPALVNIDVKVLLKWANDRVGLGMTLEAVLKMHLMLYTSTESLRRHLGTYYNVLLKMWKLRKGAIRLVDEHFWLRAFTKFALTAVDKRSKRMQTLAAMAKELGYENGRLPPLPAPHRFTDTRSYTARDVARIGCKIVFKGDNVVLRIGEGKHGFPRLFLNNKDIMKLFRNGVADLSSMCLTQTSPTEPTNVLIILDMQRVSWMSEISWSFTMARTTPRPRAILFPVKTKGPYVSIAFSPEWYNLIPVFEPPDETAGDDDLCVIREGTISSATSADTLDLGFGDAGDDAEPAPAIGVSLTTVNGACPVSGGPILYPVVSAICNNIRHKLDARSFLMLRDQTKENRYFKCPVCSKPLSILALRRIVSPV